MGLTQEELEKLKATKSDTAWTSVGNDVKRARARQYSPDWYMSVVVSGLTTSAQANWR